MEPKTNEDLKKWVLEILGYEYEEGVPLGDYANILKEFETLLTEKDQELQKAREEERERIKRYIQKRRKEVNIFCAGTGDIFVEEIMKEIDQSELDQPNK